MSVLMVKCIISYLAYELTNGMSYEVESVEKNANGQVLYSIVNDKGQLHRYNENKFVSLGVAEEE